jgi:hypothetical protein
VSVSPGKPRFRCEKVPAPMLGTPSKTNKLTFLVIPLSGMGFRGSRVQIPASRLTKPGVDPPGFRLFGRTPAYAEAFGFLPGGGQPLEEHVRPRSRVPERR